MLASFSRRATRATLTSTSTRSYAVVASCKQPYDTSSSVFDAANEVERVIARAKYEQNLLLLMYLMQPLVVTEEFRKFSDDHIKKRWKKENPTMSDRIDKLDIGGLIDEDVVEMDEEEAAFLLKKQDYATILGQYFKFKPRLSSSSVDAVMALNKPYYQKQILSRSKAILDFASAHKNDYRKDRQ